MVTEFGYSGIMKFTESFGDESFKFGRCSSSITYPSKALTLSFHGGTGTGKNYVSKIIAESIYKEGMRSKYVHLISATKEFPHKDMVPLYKDKLRNLVESSVNECPQSLFIFDEIDKMPAGILDTLKPYFDFYEQLLLAQIILSCNGFSKARLVYCIPSSGEFTGYKKKKQMPFIEEVMLRSDNVVSYGFPCHK
uniref:Torsin-1A n=1 Tax=Magallana gigas TaxID=29159 RepID=K1QAM2_MAGGI